MNIADMLAAAAVAVLAGMGVGGGGLLTLYLVLVKEMGQVEAQGINLVFFVFSAAASLIYSGRRRKINWRLVLLMAVPGCLLAPVGAWTASVMDGGLLRRMFGWLMIVSGGAVFLGKIKRKRKNKKTFEKGVDKSE